ncbi:FAD binding domain-containing protein [Bradyrhizobium cajani]|nr:FAD binding domain-containing protein [Bradyrhizobium cajani]MCP3371822.1 FAD binding domain-containing protein [Bradyrhizobium cajani]
MFPAPILEYFRPASVGEATRLLSGGAGENAHIIAGGQSLMQAIKSRLISPDALIDLQDIKALRSIHFDKNGLVIGAMTSYADIASDKRIPAAFAALCDAAGHVGDRQVRNRGTIGGSLCWNYIAACLPPTCLGLSATLELQNAAGRRRMVEARAFLKGPLETDRSSDELLIAIHLGPAAARTGSAYRKWGLVTDALPVVNICVSLEVGADHICREARVALGARSEGPTRVEAAELALRGVRKGDVRAIDAALDAAAEAADYQSDLWADAPYKKVLLRKIGREAVTVAFARASGEVGK